MLKFRVEGQKLTWENPDEVVVAGTKKYLECYFEFDGDEWSGFEHIDVFFKNGRDKPVQMLLVGNRIRKEDGLCLTAGDWAVYLRAVVSKKKVDEEGNVVYEEDGVTPVMELERQMTSSSVSVRVLAHGQFENVQNSFESPEIANQYIAQMLDAEKGEAARNVFEEYDPEKEYVRGNKVAFGGSSYVLIVERALGINPTDTGSWLCIARKGEKGEFADVDYELSFSSLNPVSNLRVTNEIYNRLTHFGELDKLPPHCGYYSSGLFKASKDIMTDEYLITVEGVESFGGGVYEPVLIMSNMTTLFAKAMKAASGNIIRFIFDEVDYSVTVNRIDYDRKIISVTGDGTESGVEELGRVFTNGNVLKIKFYGNVDTSEIETARVLFAKKGDTFAYVTGYNDSSTEGYKYYRVASENVFFSDEYGNVTYGDNSVGCKAYYIKSIDLVGKKIYLSEEQVVPVISTADNTDTSFATPAYDVGDGFSIVNKNHYNNCGTIASVVNNVVTYSEDSLGFTAINEDTDGGIADYTFRVYNKPDIGVVTVTKYAFAVGSENKALGSFSSAEGGGNVADGFYSHVEGLNNYAAYGAHAEGGGNMAVGNESHVEGHKTKATAGNAHSEGQNTTASGGGAHAEGMGSTASGSQSHAEGLNTTASGAHSHAEGVNTRATVYAAHAEGNDTTASGQHSHAEGYKTIASGISSHAEGQETKATNSFAHAQGIRTYAEGYAAFTSGSDVWASGDVSTAMGKNARATARASLAVGENVTASGEKSVALGLGTTAKQQGQIAVGMYNADDADAVFIVGGGTASARKNVFAVKKDGRIFVNGVEFTGGTSGAMVFKDVVDALPTTANENDVYTVSPWKNEGTYSNISMSLHSNIVDFSEWNGLANFLYSDVQSDYGCSYKFVIGGASYIYTECGVNSAGDDGFGMAGQTDDVASVVSVSGATVTVYRAASGADVINRSYIYRSGEWIPLFG